VCIYFFKRCHYVSSFSTVWVYLSFPFIKNDVLGGSGLTLSLSFIDDDPPPPLVTALARHVLVAKSREYIPLTIWLVDNSSSMLAEDGKRFVETSSTTDIRVLPCTRWAELQETVRYHAQLAALLQAPTKFLLLNDPQTGKVATHHSFSNYSSSSSSSSSSHQCEWSIAERGSDWISADSDQVVHSFSSTRLIPVGVTPLTVQLRGIFQSLASNNTITHQKIVVVVATDGKPTDASGYTSPLVDRDFEQALRQLSTKASIVIRLCTNDDSILQYYQQFDEENDTQQLLDEEGFFCSVDVLDDYLDEAKEIYKHNPWLTYSLGLHRCREMGMSCHSNYQWLDWLDERPLTRLETVTVLETLGLSNTTNEKKKNIDDDAIRSTNRALVLEEDEAEEWNQFCDMVERQQQQQIGSVNNATAQDGLEIPGRKSPTTSGDGSCNGGGGLGNVYLPWNPIRRKPTPWIDMNQFRRHTGKIKAKPRWNRPTSQSWWWWSVIFTVLALVLAMIYGR
jgi:hypothetical protein